MFHKNLNDEQKAEQLQFRHRFLQDSLLDRMLSHQMHQFQAFYLYSSYVCVCFYISINLHWKSCSGLT